MSDKQEQQETTLRDHAKLTSQLTKKQVMFNQLMEDIEKGYEVLGQKLQEDELKKANWTKANKSGEYKMAEADEFILKN